MEQITLSRLKRQLSPIVESYRRNHSIKLLFISVAKKPDRELALICDESNLEKARPLALQLQEIIAASYNNCAQLKIVPIDLAAGFSVVST